MRPSTSSSTTSSSSLLAPSTPTTHSRPTYIRCGIGGAGNWHKASSIPPSTPNPNNSIPTPTASSTSPHAPLLLPHAAPSSPTHFKSGIGGAGNIHAASARSVLDFEEELARHRAVERNAPAAFHVGIGGAGNSRCRGSGMRKTGGERHLLRSRKSAGVLEVGGGQGNAAFGRQEKVEFGEESVDEYEMEQQQEEDEYEHEQSEHAYYSNEPLPYGALDILRRRLEQTFSRGREVLAPPSEKGRGLHAEGQERRFLRSHRSMWRF